jgi:hypothetical protein
LPANSTKQLAKQVSAISLKTCAGVLGTAPQQAAGFANDQASVAEGRVKCLGSN